MNYNHITKKEDPLICNELYHIYNKTVGEERLFRTEKDYTFFLAKLKRFIQPIADIYAYCLIPNHFHLFLKIKDQSKIPELRIDNKETEFLTQTFTNFFISYSKSFNKAHNRMGRLLLQPFKRKLVEDYDYFTYLLAYIHRNPIHHGLVSDFSDWKYSSYNSFLLKQQNILDIKRKEVLSYFYSLEEFIDFHEDNIVKPGQESFYLE